MDTNFRRIALEYIANGRQLPLDVWLRLAPVSIVLPNSYGLTWVPTMDNGVQQVMRGRPVIEEDPGLFIPGKTSLDPVHMLIEGENYHALTVLQDQYAGKIKAIVADPPYNHTRGSNLCYQGVLQDDSTGENHSLWLSFMDYRLRLAHCLLEPSGVIFICIDDTEVAQLKLLCNQIFGEENFIAQIVWHNAIKNKCRRVSKVHEYLLVYGRDLNCLKSKWQRQRESTHSEQMRALVQQSLAEGQPREEIEHRLMEYTHQSGVAWLNNYFRVDDDGRIFYAQDLSFPGKPNQVALKNGVILEPLRSRAWQKAKAINALLDQGKLHWNGSRPYKKVYLDEAQERLTSVISGIFTRSGTAELKQIFGQDVFSFPKPTKLIRHLFSFFQEKDGIYLDFFAGSGTTGHAILQLNAEDGGQRQFILCTNNENSICEKVTYPRLKNVIQGYTNRKGQCIAGLGGCLRYFRCAFTN